MMTFLPYPDYIESAKVLDTKRLGKQRIEARMILQLHLEGRYRNWRYHPVVQMWKPYLGSLADYGLACCQIWKDLGYKDTTVPIIESLHIGTHRLPSWLGDERFHSNQRSILLGKNLQHYSQFNWEEEPAQLKYGHWPYYFPPRRTSSDPCLSPVSSSGLPEGMSGVLEPTP